MRTPATRARELTEVGSDSPLDLNSSKALELRRWRARTVTRQLPRCVRRRDAPGRHYDSEGWWNRDDVAQLEPGGSALSVEHCRRSVVSSVLQTRSQPLALSFDLNVMSSEDVASFTGITGASAQQAAFYIESSGGHLEVSPASFDLADVCRPRSPLSSSRAGRPSTRAQRQPPTRRRTRTRR